MLHFKLSRNATITLLNKQYNGIDTVKAVDDDLFCNIDQLTKSDQYPSSLLMDIDVARSFPRD